MEQGAVPHSETPGGNGSHCRHIGAMPRLLQYAYSHMLACLCLHLNHFHHDSHLTPYAHIPPPPPGVPLQLRFGSHNLQHLPHSPGLSLTRRLPRPPRHETLQHRAQRALHDRHHAAKVGRDVRVPWIEEVGNASFPREEAGERGVRRGEVVTGESELRKRKDDSLASCPHILWRSMESEPTYPMKKCE
jgi:hypothetical protein